ncbi:MAG: hypothetical protein J3Q66DRAFT_311615 [Benniella sp.]|nr:MAG: hypothetical protein J3Q66DRAFT_311615 [Benniella sp.]
MAATDIDLIPARAAFCAASPSTCDSAHGSDHIRLAFARSLSTHTNTSHPSRPSLHSLHSLPSHRLSLASSHLSSSSSIRSHVSSFQNVRFDPDPIKDISFWGGLALLISNMTGPGLVTLPIVAQSAGWLPTLLGFGLAATLSSLSSLFICEAMTEVPGNDHFQSNVEFSNLILCFFGRRYHLLVQIICFLAMQTTNIASIVVSAQLFDNLLIKIFHGTCGIQVHPNVAWVCATEQLQSASPFTGVMIMTTGVLLSFSMVLPLGLLKLSENIWVQLVSFGLLLLIIIQWIVTFFLHGLDTTLVPAIGSDTSQTFGTILFNYAFITTVPSWANAKKPGVSIHKTIGWSVGITTIFYLAVAILGGMAYQISSDSSLIQAISSSPDVTVLSQITGYTFPIAALITSIPINTIVIRYNLIQSGACNRLWANLSAGVLPWLIAIPCMTGSGLTTIINWSSLFLVSTAHFVIPFILYIHSKKHRGKLTKLPIIEMEQQERLSREVSRISLLSHSARITTVSASARRRLTGSSSQSHPELTIAPPTGIAAATVIPVVVGIGSGSLIQQSGSAESLAKELQSTQQGSNQQHQNDSISNGPNSATDKGDIDGPYFSYSQDGELFEDELSTPHSQGPSQCHPISGSTVVLHDPMTEMAQHRTPSPKRVSHKDRILSMISEKHKRVVEQQAKRSEEDQSKKPVPPMILLSHSMAPENEDNNPTRDIELNELESKDYMGTRNTDLSSAIKRLNRRISIVPPKNMNRPTLDLQSSPIPLNSTRSMLDPGHDTKENALELSPMLSLPLSTTTTTTTTTTTMTRPRKSPFECSYLGSPQQFSPDEDGEMIPQPCISLSISSPKDEQWAELTTASTSRLGIRVETAGLAPMYNTPGPDSAASINSLGRRVSFSDEVRLFVPSPELGCRPSFEGTKQVLKATQYTGNGHDSSGRMAAAFVAQPGSFSIQTKALDTFQSSTKAVKDQTKAETGQGCQQGTGTSRLSSSHLTLSPSAPPSSQPDPPLNGRIRSRTVSTSAALQGEATRPQKDSGWTSSMQSLKEKDKESQIRFSNQLAVPNSASNHSVHLMPPSRPFATRSNNIDISPPVMDRARGAASSLISSAPSSPQKSPSHHSVGGRNIRLSASAKSLAAPFQGGYNYAFPGFGFSHSPTSNPLHPPPSPGQQSLCDPPQSAQGVGSPWFYWRRHSREPSRSTVASAGSPHPSILDTEVRGHDGGHLLDPPGSPPGKENERALEGCSDMCDTNLHASPHELENGRVYDATWGLRAIPSWIPVSSLKVAWSSLALLIVTITATIVYDFVQLALGNDVMSGS